MMNRFSRVAVVCAAFVLAFGSALADSEQLAFRVGTLTAESQGGSGAEARALVILGQRYSTQTFQLKSLTTPSGAELMPATWFPRTLQGALVAYGLKEAQAGVYKATVVRAYAFDWLGTAERPLDLDALPDRLAASELHVRFDVRY